MTMVDRDKREGDSEVCTTMCTHSPLRETRGIIVPQGHNAVRQKDKKRVWCRAGEAKVLRR